MFCTASSEPNAVWPVDVINTKTGGRCQQFSNDVYLIDLSFDIPYVTYFTCTPKQRILNGTFKRYFVTAFGVIFVRENKLLVCVRVGTSPRKTQAGRQKKVCFK